MGEPSRVRDCTHGAIPLPEPDLCRCRTTLGGQGSKVKRELLGQDLSADGQTGLPWDGRTGPQRERAAVCRSGRDGGVVIHGRVGPAAAAQVSHRSSRVGAERGSAVSGTWRRRGQPYTRVSTSGGAGAWGCAGPRAVTVAGGLTPAAAKVRWALRGRSVRRRLRRPSRVSSTAPTSAKSRISSRQDTSTVRSSSRRCRSTSSRGARVLRLEFRLVEDLLRPPEDTARAP